MWSAEIGENNLCATEKHQQPTPIKDHPETICGQMGQKLKFLAKKKKHNMCGGKGQL